MRLTAIRQMPKVKRLKNDYTGLGGGELGAECSG